MKKKSYFSFLCGRLIAGLLIGVIVFAASTSYMKNAYNHSVKGGFNEVGEKYTTMLRQIDEGRYDGTFIDIIANLYSAEYARFAKVGEDGSFETIYETDYDVIPVELNIHNWIYVTKDEELLAEGKRSVSLNNSDWTIEYKKCDELWNIDPVTDKSIEYSWNANSFGNVSGYGNDIYRSVSEICGMILYRIPQVGSYYVDGDTLHVGKVIVLNGNDREIKSQGWDFTDAANADKYQSVDARSFDVNTYIFQRSPRPDNFLNSNPDIFLAESMDELERLNIAEDARVYSHTNDHREYYVTSESDGKLTQGKLIMTNVEGQWYMVEYVMTTVSYQTFLEPFIIVLAILLLVLSIAIPCLSAIRPYSQYKKAYENNRFKNNLIDSLAHNLKTPLQILGGYAENLKDTTSEADKNRYADEILAKTSEMNKDIEAILKTADKTSLTLSKTSVRKCLEEVASKLDSSIDIKGDADYKIEKDYFNTALFCLLDNAAKYGSEGSKTEAEITSKTITIRNKTSAGKFTPGTGIAIAGRILEQHRMKLTTDLKDGVFEAKISTK